MDDYEAVRALYEEPGMLAYMPSFFPAEEPEAYFESYVKNMYRFYDFGMYVLEDARTGRIIGHVGLGVEDSEDPDGRETERIEEARLDDSIGSDRWEPEAPTVETGRQKSEEATGKTDRQASETETAVEDGIAVKEPIDARITLGYVISTPYRGKGLASFACRQILLYARDSLYLDRVWIRVDQRNRASLAVARRLQQQFGDFIKVDVTEI